MSPTLMIPQLIPTPIRSAGQRRFTPSVVEGGLTSKKLAPQPAAEERFRDTASIPVMGRIAPTLAIPTGIKGETLSRDPSVAATQPVILASSFRIYPGPGAYWYDTRNGIRVRKSGYPDLNPCGAGARNVPTMLSAKLRRPRRLFV